uniref:CCHC-type domain-containing protein n=1 Tax=Tanacetum cinerariifolium TaxID=118510 RepID=A0A6L2J127_TANCI|nr:hypothetical protein [Tanacetum cinerariifolium]
MPITLIHVDTSRSRSHPTYVLDKMHEASGGHTLHEASGSDIGLELHQEDDTRHFENTSEHHNEVEHMDVELIVKKFSFVDPKGCLKHLIDMAYIKVCKLQRSVCGLKQASRSWNKRFDEEIKKVGFTQNLDEPCVYVKANVKSWLCKCLAMKDLGEAAYILGIKTTHDRSYRLIALSQSVYSDKILNNFKIENSKSGHVPMQKKPNLSKAQDANTPDEVKRMQRVPYASAIGTATSPTTTRETTLDDLTPEEKIREACDIKETNIVLQGLPPDLYSLVNHHKVAKDIRDRVKFLMKGSELSLAPNSEWFKGKMLLAQAQEVGVALDAEQLAFLADTRERVDSGIDARALTTTPIFQTDDMDAFDSDYYEAPTTSVIFMANFTAYDSNVLSKVPNYDTYQDNNVFDQSVQEINYLEQPVFVDNSKNKITSDSNVISYDQYLKENENEVVQAKCNAVNQENKIMNESLTVELEQYKEMKFQENSDDEVDERSSEDYLKDLDIEFHKRALLENSKRFIKRKNNFSSQKANENTECFKCGKKGHFAKDCFSKTSKPSYKSLVIGYSSVSKDYKAEYKKVKAKIALLEASPFTSQTPKAFQPKNKGLTAKTFNWDKEEVFDDEEVTQLKVMMALANDELTIGKNHARNSKWIDITMRKVIILLSMDEDADWKNYLKLVERLNPNSKLPNFNIGGILVHESQVVNESLKPAETTTKPKSSKDSEVESFTPLPPLKTIQGASPSSEVESLTFQPHSPKERPCLGILKHKKPKTQDSLNKSVSGTVTVSETEPTTPSVPIEVKNTKQESKINELSKLVQMLINEKDEEVLRQKLEEEARAEKEWEEKRKQEKAEYELSTLEFRVQSDSKYKTD